MTPALLRFRPVLAPAAGILLFLGERLWGATPARPFLAVLAIVLLLAALAWELPGRKRRSAGGSRLSLAYLWRYERLPPALFLLAAALYFGGRRLGSISDHTAHTPSLRVTRVLRDSRSLSGA
ncbi:MAG: hypothetical protein IIA14_07990 [SAR324 cluster bacterium]|nr:hypothetical protein [SAR324 cluster bacterium]